MTSARKRKRSSRGIAASIPVWNLLGFVVQIEFERLELSPLRATPHDVKNHRRMILISGVESSFAVGVNTSSTDVGSSDGRSTGEIA